MFKPVHSLLGTLTTGVSAVATSIVLDEDSACILSTILKEPGDYTYLMISQLPKLEIVKVTATLPNIVITRAQDGTTAQSFTAGATVEFVFSESAIQDIINEKSLGQVQLIGDGIVTVLDLGNNTFKISAPEISITSSSPDILVGGEFPNFIISAPVKLDCCD